jgi:phosphoserine aminotransferase
MTPCRYNFNPGPAAVPRPVLEQVQRELLDFAGSGMSVLELSHRDALYERLHNEAIADLRAILGCPEEYSILFIGGGAAAQFDLVPMHLLPAGRHAAYLVTGLWSAMALRAGRRWGEAREVWSGAATGYDRVPERGDFAVAADAAYLHYTSNNTVVGTQFPAVLEAGSVPLVCDMTSDLLSRPLPVSRFGLIYASAQKNLGIAGVTVVIIHRALLERCQARVPQPFDYPQMAATNSLLNTPPVFAIYVLGLVVKYQLAQGGLAAVAARNAEKAALLYAAVDNSGGFYGGCAQPPSRSQMNVTFRLPTAELEARFVAASVQAGLVGLQGHRSVGGIRASLYNGVSLEAVQALVAFMQDFQRQCG